MTVLDDKDLETVGGGRLKDADAESITDWLRLNKDMGQDFETIMQGMENDYKNQVEYYDLTDTEGNHVSLAQFRVYCRNIWDSIS